MPSKQQFTTSLRNLVGLAIVGLAVAAAYFECQEVLKFVPENLNTPFYIAFLCAITGLIWATALVVVRKIGAAMFETRIRSGKFSTLIGSVVYSLMTAPFVLVYLLCWYFFKETGRFPGWEVLYVGARNKYPMLQDLVSDLNAISPDQKEMLTYGAILFGAVLPLTYLLSSFAAGADSPRLKNLVARLWLGCAIVVMGGALFLFQFAKPAERDVQVAHLSKASNPFLGLGTSAWESFSHDRIEPVLDNDKLAKQDTEWSAPTSSSKPPIIIVAIESLRHDVVDLSYQGREVTPNLNKLAKAGLRWKKAYSQSTHSNYSDACIVSSLYPLRSRVRHVHDASERFPTTHIYDLLKPVGYATAVVSSRNEAASGLSAFYQSENLDLLEYADASDEMPSASNDAAPASDDAAPTSDDLGEDPGTSDPHIATAADTVATDKAIDWIKQQSGQPFFLSVSLNSTVFPYTVSDDVEKPFTPYELGDDVVFGSFPQEKTANVRNAYFNAIHEADRQLGRLVDALESQNVLDNAILVVTGKNGEAFQLNGRNGHTLQPVESALHVATVFHAPSFVRPNAEDYPLEHVDLVPTILGMMDWPTHPNFQGTNALASNRVSKRERLMFFHVIEGGTRCDAVLFGGRWKYIHNYATNRGNLYDIVKDPREAHDVTAEQSKLSSYLHKTLKAWREQQLAFYHYPDYYTTSYPPKAPRWESVKKKEAVAETPSVDGNES